MKPWPVPQTKLNSGQVRLRKCAKILALGPHLCTRISLRTMTGLLKKKLLSICQSGWREIRNAFPVISLSLLEAWNKDIGTASQTLLTGWTGVRLRMRRRLAIKLRMYALTFSYVNFLSGPMSVVLILNTSFFFRSNVSSVLHINRNELKQSILHFCQFFRYMHLCTLFCFYKNVVFPAQVEYSYFSAIFRLDFILVLFSN